jgi:hypothetical protein
MAIVEKKIIGWLPYFAEYLPAGLRARNTPAEIKSRERPRVAFEISRILLKSGILATKLPALKPLIMKVIVTAIRARLRARSISCEVYSAKVNLSFRLHSAKSG